MTTAAPTPWQLLGETVAEFRGECSEFEQLVQSLFDQLEQLRSELDHRVLELEREREQLAARERELNEQRQETNRFAHQFEHQEAKLCQTLTELDELKTLVRQATEGSFPREPLPEAGQWQQHREALEHERRNLQEQLSAAHAELTQSAALARDLAEARKEVADLRAQAMGAPAVAATGASPEEQAALEAELEMVRSRAAELYDTLAQERQAIALQRAEAAEELKQLRRIVEKQAELLGERPSPAAPSPPASAHLTVKREVAVGAAEEAGDDAADPVVNSVMAQFAKLQKEVAERRKHRKP